MGCEIRPVERKDGDDGIGFQARGKARYTILYFDENGRRRKKAGVTDKAVSERIAHDLENKVALSRQGLIDPKAEAYRDHEVQPLADHLADWQAESSMPRESSPSMPSSFSIACGDSWP